MKDDASLMSSMPRAVKMAALALMVGIAIQILFDPISSVKHSMEISGIRAELPRARAKWDAQRITDYTFEIVGNAPLICQPSAIIEVKNDVVVKVQIKDFSSEASSAQLLLPEKWADPDWGDEVFLCNYANFTMTRIFNLLDRALRDNPPTAIQADFDPDYGFVANFSYGLFVGHGLLSPRISECCNGLSVKNFHPLVSP